MMKTAFQASPALTTETKDLLLINKKLKFFLPGETNFITGQNIFYKLLKTADERKFNYEELGIGEIYKKGRDYFFRREYCFSYNTGTDFIVPAKGNPPTIELQDGEVLFLSKTLPEKYSELLASENSVLCSTERFTPTPVELDDRSVLGRLNGEIQSIDKHELRKIITDSLIVEAVSQYKRTVDINSGNLNIKNPKSRISTPYLFLKPNEDVKSPQEGYIRYNKKDKCFEGYDGESWRSLIWETNNEDAE